MANDLPSNLDDGELWLPSDVIRAVGVCRRDHRRVPSRLNAFPTDFDAIDSLSQKLAAFSLLERRREIQRFFPNPEYQFQFPTQASVGYKVPAGRRVASGDDVVAGTGGTGAFFPVSRAVHKFHPGIPVDAQGYGVQLERARILQSQNQSRCSNRYFPNRVKISGRESGGTGVFLPRTVSVDSRKKSLSVKGRVQFQQREPIWNPMLGPSAGNFLPSSEMSLPNDWTY